MEGGPFMIEAGELALRKPEVPAKENLLDWIQRLISGD